MNTKAAPARAVERHLEWEGCFNVRDLGGLPTIHGWTTRWGEVVRADSLGDLTAAGWAAVEAYGIRTVIDLRNEDELGADASPRPSTVATIHIPLDVADDREFWDVWASGPQFGTPLYYGPHLERFPERSAAVLEAIARPGAGGIVFHCGGGRDRAGQIAMLLLTLAGVPSEAIAADYALSSERLSARYSARGEEDQGPLLESFLAERGTSASQVIVATLQDLDVERRMREAGLAARDVRGLRRRLLGSE